MEACHRGEGEKVASSALQEEREKSEPLLMGRNTGEVKQAEKLHNMRKSQAISTRTLWDSTGPDCPVLPALDLYRGSDVAHSLWSSSSHWFHTTVIIRKF